MDFWFVGRHPKLLCFNVLEETYFSDIITYCPAETVIAVLILGNHFEFFGLRKQEITENFFLMMTNYKKSFQCILNKWFAFYAAMGRLGGNH